MTMFVTPVGAVPGEPPTRQFFPSLEPRTGSSVAKQIHAAFKRCPDRADIHHGVRRVKRGCPGRRTAQFYSQKSGGSFVLESEPELLYALVLEQDPTVLSFRTQALRIDIPGWGTAYPDFVVRFKDHFEVHEVKPSLESLSQTKTEWHESLERVLRDHGFHYKMVFGDQLPTRDAFESTAFHYTRAYASPLSGDQIERAREVFALQPPINLAQAYAASATHQLPPNCVDYLVFHGELPLSSKKSQRCGGAE